MARTVDRRLARTWEKATDDPDALAALEASRDLYRQLSDWQATLVAEALQSGATWEAIGAALGSTRQAAWARFRNAIHPEEAGAMDARQQAIDEMKALHTQMRAREQRWREQRKQVETDIRAARERLHSLDQERQRDRQALRAEFQRKKASVRQLGRKIKEPH